MKKEEETKKTTRKAPAKGIKKETKVEELKLEEKEETKVEAKKESKPKSKEEILKYVVIGLAAALVLSLVFNIVQAVKNGGNNTFVKYNGKKVTLDDAMDELIKAGGDKYIDKLSNIIVYESLSADDISAVQDDVDQTIEYYTQIYGDQFDELVASQTNFANGEEYAKYYLATNGVIDMKTAEKCAGTESQYCQSIETYQFLYDTLKAANVEFSNKDLQKRWDDALNGYQTYISDLKREEAGFENLEEVSVGDIKSKIKNKESFVLMVSQTTCSHCKAFKPVIDEVAEEYGFKVYVVESNLLEESDYKDLQKIISYDGTPTTGVFIKGKLEDTIEGESPKASVIEFLTKYGIIK